MVEKEDEEQADRNDRFFSCNNSKNAINNRIISLEVRSVQKAKSRETRLKLSSMFNGSEAI
jgi:hypothetical protein